MVEDFSLSKITATLPGVQVAKGEVFADLSESDIVKITITCNSWNTSDDSENTWYCYTIDGETYKGDFDWDDDKPVVTITGKDITTLKSGALTIYGNNTDAKVTVTVTKSEGTDDEGKKYDEGEKPATLPTAVVLNNKIDGTTWAETAMTKSTTDGIWTCELTISNQLPNFNIKATFGENDALYKGGEVKLDESGTITRDGSNDIWCNIGEKYNGAKISVTVDFTGTEPSIKIALVKEGSEVIIDGADGEKKEETPPLPTAVVLKSKIDDSGWNETTMTKSATDGIWTCKLTVSNQWPNFNVKATIDGKTIWYKGESEKGTEVTLGSAPATMSTGEEGDKDNLYCNIGEKCNGAEISVTVDFTGKKPSIKIALDKEGTVPEDKKPLATELPIENISLSGITTEEPGILVAKGTVFSDVNESNTITVAITCKTWQTTDNSTTWYCYTIDGETYKGNFVWVDDQPAATITGKDITTLKSGALTIYGNNTDATVTVTYK